MRYLKGSGDPKKVTVPQWYDDMVVDINRGVIPQATRQDSLFLLNNNREIEKLKAKGYREQYNNTYVSSPKDVLTAISTAISSRDHEAGTGKLSVPASDYFDFSNPPFVGTSDWVAGGGDDIGMPMHYMHPAINPTHTADHHHRDSDKPSVFTHAYEDIMITPWDMLSPDQKNERVQMAIDTQHFGGIPQSVVDQVNQGKTPLFRQITNNTSSNGLSNQPQQPVSQSVRPDRMTPMQSISASSIDNTNTPFDITASTPIQVTRRLPKPMYVSSGRSRVGQYPVGEYYYDEEKRRYQMDPWSREERKASREYFSPRQYKVIKTPEF